MEISLDVWVIPRYDRGIFWVGSAKSAVRVYLTIMQIQKTTAFNPHISARIMEQKRAAAVEDLSGKKKEITPIRAINAADKEQSNPQPYPSKRADGRSDRRSDNVMITPHSNKLFNSNLNSKSRHALDAYQNHQDMQHNEERKQLQSLLGVDDYV